MKMHLSLRPTLTRWLDRWQPAEPVVLGGAALLVGLASGAGVWLFKQLIELAYLLAFGKFGGALSPLGGWTVFLIPVAGAWSLA